MRPSQSELVRRRIGKKPRRSALLWMVLGSVLLHLAIFGFLASRPPPPVVKPPPVPGELVEIDVEPVPQRPAPRAPTRPPPTRNPTRPPEHVEPRPPETQRPPLAETAQSTPPPAGGSQGSQSESAQSTPPARKPLVLTPSLHALPGTEGIPMNTGSQEGGMTLRPDDPSLSPTARREQERKRVHDRVQDFMETDLGEARAQRGLAHPYLAGFRESLLGTLGGHGSPTPRQLGFNGMKNLVNSYLATASQYGKTGSPGIDPGMAPTQSEMLGQRFGNQPGATPMRMQAQAAETLDSLSHHGSLYHMRVEVVQTREPPGAQIVLVESSGNGVFDTHVLKGFATTLQQASTPPADAFHGPALKTIWRIDGYFKPKHANSALSLLPSANGINAEQIAQAASPDSMEVDFHATILSIR